MLLRKRESNSRRSAYETELVPLQSIPQYECWSGGSRTHLSRKAADLQSAALTVERHFNICSTYGARTRDSLIDSEVFYHWTNALFIQRNLVHFQMYLPLASLAPEIQVSATYNIFIFRKHHGLVTLLLAPRTENNLFHVCKYITYFRLMQIFSHKIRDFLLSLHHLRATEPIVTHKIVKS